MGTRIKTHGKKKKNGTHKTSLTCIIKHNDNQHQVQQGSSQSGSPTNNGACVTNGLGEESVAGLACVFPFVVDGVTYTSCLGSGWGGQGVCRTSSGSWGGCSCTAVEQCNLVCDTYPCGGISAVSGRQLHSVYRAIRTPTTLSYVSEPLLGRIQMFDVASLDVTNSNQGLFVEVMSRDTLDASAIGVWASPPGAAKHKKGSTPVEDIVIATIQGNLILLFDRQNVARFKIDLGPGVNTKGATMAFDPQSNPRRIVLALPYHHIIRVYSTTSANTWRPSGSCVAIGASTTSCQSLNKGCTSYLCNPVDVSIGVSAADKGHMYVVDQGNHRVQVFNLQHQVVRTVGTGVLVRPEAVTVSTWRENIGHMLVLESGVRVIEFDSHGNFVGAKPTTSARDKTEANSNGFQVDAVGAMAMTHACSSSTHCSGQGTCIVDGTCMCDGQYFGAACDELPRLFLVGFWW
jgi:hypothetical protein